LVLHAPSSEASELAATTCSQTLRALRGFATKIFWRACVTADPRSRDSNIRRSWLHSRQGHHVPVEPCLELAWKCMLHPANLATGEVFAAVATLATSGLCLGETSSTNLILFLVFFPSQGAASFHAPDRSTQPGHAQTLGQEAKELQQLWFQE
jgi:hypothetical protein